MSEQKTPLKTASLLRSHGIVPTAQRMAIANMMMAKPQHLSADQVFSQLNHNTSPHVSKATVYNTLTLFVQKGLIREVIADPSRVFYCSTAKPHPHFYNVDTHELHDADPGICDVAIKDKLPEGTELDSVDIVIRVKNRRLH